MTQGGQETIQINAPPEKVYELVSDVTRMGDWSPECYRCEWQEGATGPAVGAKFKGWNKQGFIRWSTTPEVIAVEPGREFAFSTKFGEREGTRWRYRFEPSDGGTTLTESWEIMHEPSLMAFANRLLRRDRALAKGVQATLQRIKAAAEGSA